MIFIAGIKFSKKILSAHSGNPIVPGSAVQTSDAVLVSR